MDKKKGGDGSDGSDNDLMDVVSSAAEVKSEDTARKSAITADVQSVMGGGKSLLTASAVLKGIVEEIIDERIFSESEKDLLINVAALFNHSNQKDISLSGPPLKVLLQKIMLAGNMISGRDKINHWLLLSVGENCLDVLVKAILQYKGAHADKELNGTDYIDGNSALESVLELVKSYIQFKESFFQDKDAILKMGSDLGEYWDHCINNTIGVYEIGGMTGCLFEVAGSGQYMMMLREGKLSCIITPEKALLSGYNQMNGGAHYLKFSSNSLIFKQRTPIQCFAAYLAYVRKDQSNDEDFLLFQSMMFYLFLSKVDKKTAENFFMSVIDTENPSDNEQVLFLRNKIQSLSLNAYIAVGEAKKDPAVSGIYFKDAVVAGTTEGGFLKIKSQGVFVKIKGVPKDKKIGDLVVRLSIDSFNNKYKKKYEELLEKLKDDCRSELTVRLKGLEKDGAYRKMLSKLFNDLFPGEFEKQETKDAVIIADDDMAMIALDIDINDIINEHSQYDKQLTENSDAVDAWKLLWKVKMWKALHAKLVKLIPLDSAEASGLQPKSAGNTEKSKKKKKKKKKKMKGGDKKDKVTSDGESSSVGDNGFLHIDDSKLEASENNSHSSACEFESFEPNINHDVKDTGQAPIEGVGKTVGGITFKPNKGQKKLRVARSRLANTRDEVISLERLNKKLEYKVSKLIAKTNSLEEQLNTKEASLAEDALQVKGLHDQMANKNNELKFVKEQKEMLKQKVQEFESQLLRKDKKLLAQEKKITNLTGEIATHKDEMQEVVEDSKQVNEKLTKQFKDAQCELNALRDDMDKLNDICRSILHQLEAAQNVVHKEDTFDASAVNSNSGDAFGKLKSDLMCWNNRLLHREPLLNAIVGDTRISNGYGSYSNFLMIDPAIIACEDEFIGELVSFFQGAIVVMSTDHAPPSTPEKILTLLSSFKLKLNGALSVNQDNAVSETGSGDAERLESEKMSI
jgi:hypothetical protein